MRSPLILLFHNRCCLNVMVAGLLLFLPPVKATQVCDTSMLRVPFLSSWFSVRHEEGRSSIIKLNTLPSRYDLSFAEQGVWKSAGRISRICYQPEQQLLILLQQQAETGLPPEEPKEWLEAIDARTGQTRPLLHRGTLWLSSNSPFQPFPGNYSASAFSDTQALSFIYLPTGTIWIGSTKPEPFISGIRTREDTAFYPQHPDRARTKRQSNENCLSTVNVTGANQVCYGEDTNCRENNGDIFQTFISTVFRTSIETSFETIIRTQVTTRLDTQINQQLNLQTELDTQINTYIEVETDFRVSNRINTQINAEVATVKARLQGNFDITSRLATAEAALTTDLEAEADLRLRVGQISTMLDAEVETNLGLQAEVTGAEVEVNTLAFMGAGTGGGLGFLFSAVGTAMLYNRIKYGYWCCRGESSK